ncbi:MAG: CDP-diacylglycerol--serine O-phosphatidyltransferase [Rhodothermales bacterium]
MARKEDAALREARQRRTRVAVPSFFTLLNLFCGFLAITQVADGDFVKACWLIVLAGFFDALDGMMARLTNSQSYFGVELDSLSDIVSFGVAPSFLLFEFGLKEFSPLGLIVASLPAVCGAVRLARFNTNFTEKQDYFSGLPIPVQAAFVVALILNFDDAEQFSRYSPSNLSILIPIVIVLSGLMVSAIRFDALPRPSRVFIRAHRLKALAYLLALILLVVLQQIGLLISLSLYILWAIVRAFWNLFFAPLDSDGNVEYQ